MAVDDKDNEFDGDGATGDDAKGDYLIAMLKLD